MERRCDTCAKRHPVNKKKCMVLKAQIGLTKDCWAWTDDPLWLKKVNAATKKYAGRLEQEGVLA